MVTSKHSFIEIARRSQIVEAAVATIAEAGYAQASLARIAQKAGISKGVITYHFESRDELMSTVLRDVLAAFTAFVQPLVEAEDTAAGVLRAFIQSNITFMRNHRSHVTALREIGNARAEDGQVLADIFSNDVAKLRKVLREGQRRGEFRAFDTAVMAVAILSLRNGVIARMTIESDLDLDRYARELTTIVALATQKDHSERRRKDGR